MDQSAPGTNTSVILDALSGDAASRNQVIAMIQRFARHVCQGTLPAHAGELDWEDVAQECMLKFLRLSPAQFAAHGADNSYLYSFVRLTALEMARKLMRRRARDETAGRVDHRVNPSWDSGIDVERIIARLGEECARLLRQIYLSSTSYSELAIQTGLQESSVRSKVSRCIKQARRLWGQEAVRE